MWKSRIGWGKMHRGQKGGPVQHTWSALVILKKYFDSVPTDKGVINYLGFLQFAFCTYRCLISSGPGKSGFHPDAKSANNDSVVPSLLKVGEPIALCGNAPGLVLRCGLVTSRPALGRVMSARSSRRSETGAAGTTYEGGARDDNLLSAGEARAPTE